MPSVVIEPQLDGYPLIGRTGNDDMRSTKEVGHLILRGGVRHAFVEIETYKLLLDAANQYANRTLLVNGLIDELTGAVKPARYAPVASDDNAQRWIGYVLDRLKTIVETYAQRTKDP